MKIYHWRPSQERLSAWDIENEEDAEYTSGYEEAKWVEQSCISSKELGWIPGYQKKENPEGVPPLIYTTGYPFYIERQPDSTLVDVTFDADTYDFRLNWCVSYGIITIGTRPCLLGEHEECEQFNDKHRTIPNALYYVTYDKGGPSFFAIELPEDERGKGYKYCTVGNEPDIPKHIFKEDPEDEI